MFAKVLKVVTVISLLTGLGTHGAFAATNLNLYQESVVVSQNADREEQNDAIAEAFERLIVRVTGIQQALDNDAVQEALTRGSDYIATFRFDASRQFFTNVLGEQVPTKEMVLQFDKNAVDTLLVQNRLPVWGERRPDVLIWLADRHDGQEHILTDAEESDLSRTLASAAKERGIPVVLPIGDLTDSLNLSFSELYGLFSRDIETASERYQHDAILAGRIMPSGGSTVQADWLILFKGERLRLPTVSGSMASVINQGIDLVAQRLSEQYALLLDPLLIGNLSINIQGVESLADFSAVENYLKSINIITRATLNRFGEEGVEFLVEVSGDRSQLMDVLALDDRLLPVDEVTLDAQLDNRLVYQWQGN